MDNLRESAGALGLTASEVGRLLANAIRGSWLDSQAQTALLLKLDGAYLAATETA